MRLAEHSDRSDDLRQRLRAAETRAHVAEIAAQKAKATLAKTVLDAARVEAEANAARSNANLALEQENNDLRGELVRARKLVTALEGELAEAQRDVAASTASADETPPQPSDPVMDEVAPQAPVPRDSAGSRAGQEAPVRRSPRRDAAVMAVSAIVLCAGIILYPHTVGVPVDESSQSVTPHGSAAAAPKGPTVASPAPALKDVRQVSTQSRPTLPTVAVKADRRTGGSWLLWMPIERAAIEESLRRAPMRVGGVSQATRATRWAP